MHVLWHIFLTVAEKFVFLPSFISFILDLCKLELLWYTTQSHLSFRDSGKQKQEEYLNTTFHFVPVSGTMHSFGLSDETNSHPLDSSMQKTKVIQQWKGLLEENADHSSFNLRASTDRWCLLGQLLIIPKYLTTAQAAEEASWYSPSILAHDGALIFTQIQHHMTYHQLLHICCYTYRLLVTLLLVSLRICMGSWYF